MDLAIYLFGLLCIAATATLALGWGVRLMNERRHDRAKKSEPL